jgi:putative ABC transport system permease protein
MLLVAAGLAVGLPAALAGGRLIERFLYQMGSADPLTLAAIPIVLAAVGLAACLVPALRALRVDPAITLRGD